MPQEPLCQSDNLRTVVRYSAYRARLRYSYRYERTHKHRGWQRERVQLTEEIEDYKHSSFIPEPNGIPAACFFFRHLATHKCWTFTCALCYSFFLIFSSSWNSCTKLCIFKTTHFWSSSSVVFFFSLLDGNVYTTPHNKIEYNKMRIRTHVSFWNALHTPRSLKSKKGLYEYSRPKKIKFVTVCSAHITYRVRERCLGHDRWVFDSASCIYFVWFMFYVFDLKCSKTCVCAHLYIDR